MTRRLWLFGTTLLIGCSQGPKIAAPALPTRIGNWTLEYAPQPVDELIPAALAGWRYSYLGVPDILVTLYRMPTQTNAFDAVQKWRAEKGKLAFYKGPYFGIADGPGAELARLNRFVEVLQKELAQA